MDKGNSVQWLTKSFIVRRVKGRSSSVVRSCVCDQLSWETGVEEVSVRCFLKDATEGLFLIWKGKEFKRTGA